jgi:hypothetical protein
MSQLKEADNAVLILFGGGDAGGIRIDANGTIHRIDPYGPAVAGLGAAVGQLSRAADALHGDGGDLEHTIKQTTEQFVRELDMPQEVHAIVVVNDGAPWCGTRPGGWRPRPLP